MTAGIIFAFLALISWGFGDFFLQRAIRSFGSLRTLLYVSVTGSVVLLPFIPDAFFRTTGNPFHLALLLLTGIVIFFAALFDFEALKRGKLAIIEPILSSELIITVMLSLLFWGEWLSGLQLLLAGTTFLGIVLAITVHHTHLHYHKRMFERGVIFAGVGAIVMGLVNFLVGVASQEISPLLTIWFTNVLLTAFCLLFLAVRGEFRDIVSSIARNPRAFIAVSLLDNAAWLFFAFSTSLIPIALATTISEAYIALTVLLGLFINKERLKYHQYVGIAVAIGSVIFLAAVTG